MSSGRADRAGERDGDAEAGPGDARDPHGLGGLLGGLDGRAWAASISSITAGGRTALLAAEPTEGHLDALHVLAGGDEPVGGAPQRVLIEQAQLADERGRTGRAASRPRAPAAGCRAPSRVASASTAASMSAAEVVGARVGQRGGRLARRRDRAARLRRSARSPSASSSAAARQRSARSQAASALARRWRSASTPAVPDWRVAASARTRSSWASTSAYWRRAAPSWASRSCSSRACELGAHRGGGLLLGEGLLELRGDLLEGGARLTELRRLVVARRCGSPRRGRRPARA